MKPVEPFLLRAVRPARRFLALSTAIGLVTGGLVVAQAVLLASGIAATVDPEQHHRLPGLAVGLAVVVCARAAVASVADAAAHRTAATVKAQLRTAVLRRAAEPDRASSRAHVVTLLDRGLDALDEYFAAYLPQLALAVVVPLVTVAVLLVVDLTAGIIVVVTLPLIPLFMALVGMATEASNRRRWDALTRLSHHFLDVVEGMPTLRAFGRDQAQVASVAATTDRYRAATMVTLRRAFLSTLTLELLATLSVALVAVSTGLRMVDGELGLATGLAAILLAPEAYAPLRQLGVRYHAAAAGVAVIDDVQRFVEEPRRAAADEASAPRVEPPPGDDLCVVVEGVSVRHPGSERATPNDARLTLSAGRVVCLSGESGVGKSTFVAVLLGLRRPDSGSVRVEAGGRSVLLDDIDRERWSRQLAWVHQTPFVVAGTAADNVRLGAPDADDGVVADCLARVGLAVDLHRPVAAMGRDLSAGERRRLATARALARRGRLLVLDEPTAGLDAESERTLLAAVRSAADAGAAVLLVSHRPAARAMADTVVTW